MSCTASLYGLRTEHKGLRNLVNPQALADFVKKNASSVRTDRGISPQTVPCLMERGKRWSESYPEPLNTSSIKVVPIFSITFGISTNRTTKCIIAFQKIYFNTDIFITSVHLWPVKSNSTQKHSWHKKHTTEQVLTCLCKYNTTSKWSSLIFRVGRREIGTLTHLYMLEVFPPLISMQCSL